MMKNNQSGQSTVEFIFCFVFAVSLIFLIFTSAMNYTTGYLVHYATFMASRVFMTQDANQNVFGPGERGTAETIARSTFNNYNLSVFGVETSGFNINDRLYVDAGEYLMIGAYTRFEKRIDLMGQITGQKKLEMISESYLGREPTRGVCAQRTCKAVTGSDQCEINMDITLFDNGC